MWEVCWANMDLSAVIGQELHDHLQPPGECSCRQESDAEKVLAPADLWSVYLQASEACWQGRVADFLTQLRRWRDAPATT